MIEHVAVHCGSNQQGCAGGDNGGGQRVIGQSQGQLGNAVHRCRSYDYYVGASGQRDMLIAELGIGVEGVGHYLAVGDATTTPEMSALIESPTRWPPFIFTALRL